MTALEFGAPDELARFDDEQHASTPKRGHRLAALRRAIAEQSKLNSRVVKVSMPETCVFDLDLRIPTDQSEIGEIGEQATRAHKGKGVAVQAQLEVTLAAMMLARFCVAIHADGEAVVDATAERASAFADPELIEDLNARNSVDAVRKLFGNDSVLKAYADAFYNEYNGGEPDVAPIEDPTDAG